MKLEFRDELERDAIDLYFEIADDSERDITVEKAEIQWSLTIIYNSWGIDGFQYELKHLIVPIAIDTVLENGTIEVDWDPEF